MNSAGQRHRGLLTASLLTSLALLLSACGGGGEPAVTTEPSEAGSPDATALAASAASKESPKTNRHRALAYQRKGITAVVVARDGNAVGVASADGKIRVLDALGSQETRVLKPAGGAATAGLVFSADGKYLVAVGRDSVAQFWNIETGERRFTLRGHEQPLRSVATSASGAVIATGGEETRVMLWDGLTGKLMRVLGGGHTDFVNVVSVSPDGRLVASGDAAARVLIWEVATGKLLHTLLGHANEVNALAFGADGKRLASAGEDGKVLLWDVSSGLQTGALDGQAAPVRSLAFNASGDLLAGGAIDGKVLVWDMATRKVLQQLTGSTSAVNAVAFGVKNVQRLFAGNEASDVLSWTVAGSTAR